MRIINRTEGGHEWEKQNLVTVFKGNRHYDILKCKNCGIVGKTISLTSLNIKESYSQEKVNNCPGRILPGNNRLIKIRLCTAVGRAFGNLSPGSEHKTIPPPDGYRDDSRGVWVMGVREPVKVLNNEFEFID